MSLSTISYADKVLNTNEYTPKNPSCPTGAASNEARTGVKLLRCYTYKQTTKYTCGPAVVMTLLNYYGRLSVSEMNNKIEMKIANDMNAVPGGQGGTTIGDVTNWLEDNGFQVETGSDISSELLIDNIKKGTPVIMSYKNHWILAKGYRTAGHSTYLNETEIIFSDSCCHTTILPANVIDTMWAASRLKGRCSEGGQYIIARPR